MHKVLRYEVPVDSKWHVVDLTDDVLHVATKWLGHNLYGPDSYVVEFWAEYSDEVPTRPRSFRAFATNENIPSEAMWCGTADRLDGDVWHLYEMLTIKEPIGIWFEEVVAEKASSLESK